MMHFTGNIPGLVSGSQAQLDGQLQTFPNMLVQLLGFKAAAIEGFRPWLAFAFLPQPLAFTVRYLPIELHEFGLQLLQLNFEC